MIDRYSTTEMTQVWSEQEKVKSWAVVEREAIKAMVKSGVVPEKEGQRLIKWLDEQISDHSCALLLTTREKEKETRHDLAAFVDVLSESAEASGLNSQWIHYGLTSSDVVDTAFSMSIRKACGLILKDGDRLLEVLGDKAKQYAVTPMIGRTHGMTAEPTTLGLVMRRWELDVETCMSRIEDSCKDIPGKTSGAVGTYSHLGPEEEDTLLAALDMCAGGVGSQIVSRDFHAEVISNLALFASNLENIAVDIRGLSRSEIGEVSESFGNKQKGSSAMPHKKNPISTENISGLARVIRGYSLTAMENITLWHERDISHSSAERIVFPDSFGLLHFMIKRLTGVMENLAVDKKRMLRNINNTDGRWASQGIMLGLIRRGMKRHEAYSVVKDIVNKSYSDKLGFRKLMSLKLGELGWKTKDTRDCFSLKNHLRRVKEIIDDE